MELLTPGRGEPVQAYTRATAWRVPRLFPKNSTETDLLLARLHRPAVTEGADADYKIIGQAGRRRQLLVAALGDSDALASRVGGERPMQNLESRQIVADFFAQGYRVSGAFQVTTAPLGRHL